MNSSQKYIHGKPYIDDYRLHFSLVISVYVKYEDETLVKLCVTTLI
jgi:hypothetical protein